MYVDSFTRKLLLSTNGAPVLWTISGTDYYFEATYVEVLEAFLEIYGQFEILGVVTLDEFFDNIPGANPPEEIKKRGWTYECISYTDFPVLQSNVIRHTEDDKNIFEIVFDRIPCDQCMVCMGHGEDCDV